ncbi:MAG: hypothetical protein KC713_10375, partial [Candidatus Omnitrophica bacterium]|nr:hypothetical protein [Candidatus Omnitrophota bacterium]
MRKGLYKLGVVLSMVCFLAASRACAEDELMLTTGDILNGKILGVFDQMVKFDEKGIVRFIDKQDLKTLNGYSIDQNVSLKELPISWDPKNVLTESEYIALLPDTASFESPGDTDDEVLAEIARKVNPIQSLQYTYTRRSEYIDQASTEESSRISVFNN